MNKDTFIDFFRQGTLGNKVKCGKYYVRRFKDVSFLLRSESDEVDPRMLQIRDRVGNHWHVSRGGLERKGTDITHWKIIDTLKYSAWHITLFAIDGTHYLQEIHTDNLQTLDDWINYRNLGERVSIDCIIKLKKHCRTVSEARASLVEGLPKDTLVYHAGLLVPSKPNISFITPKTVHTAQWIPNIDAFNLPITSYHQRSLLDCKPHDETFNELTKDLSSNDKDRVVGFVSLYREHKAATHKLHDWSVVPKRTAERHELLAQSVGIDVTDDTTHVKGKIYNKGTKELLTTLTGWHKLVKFYTEQVAV